MPYVDRSPLNYRINTTNPILRRIESRAPIDNQDGFKTPLFTQWIDSSSDDLYILVGITNTTTTWAFVGGTPGDLSTLTVDASTPPGTNPVIPDAARSITITGGQVATGTVGANVIRTDSLAANTFTVEIQRTTDAAATDSTLNGVSHFDSAAFTVDANGFVQLVGGGTAAVEFLPDSGTTPVVPNGSGQVTMTGSDGLSFVGGANTLTVTSDNGQLLTEFLVSSGTSPVVANASGQITLTDGNGVGMTGGLNAITFDMVSPFTGDFTFQKTTSGTTVTLAADQTSDTASSSAVLLAQVAGSTAADPIHRLSIDSIAQVDHYIDNSDADSVKLDYNGVGTFRKFFATGERTLPFQPAFKARYLGANVPNATGDGTLVITANYTTEDYDIGSNFNLVAGSFTAPQYGIYLFNFNMVLSAVGAAHTSAQAGLRLNAVSLNSTWATGAGNLRNGANSLQIDGTSFLQLTSGDVVQFSFLVSGSTKTVGYNFLQFAGYMLG